MPASARESLRRCGCARELSIRKPQRQPLAVAAGFGGREGFGRSGKAPLGLEASGTTPEEIAKSAKRAMAMKK